MGAWSSGRRQSTANAFEKSHVGSNPTAVAPLLPWQIFCQRIPRMVLEVKKNIISASSPEAKAPDCKSGTKKHQRFESFLADYMKVVAI